ncbi:uncharacterized protein [Ptychodera flava]|uniref:uncharacterized protein n=1 Tax=Ptychodera flava TaxID=63121 RepID=UPI00396A9227
MPEKMRGLTDGYVRFTNGSTSKAKIKICSQCRIGKVHVLNKWTIFGVLFLTWLVWLIWYLKVHHSAEKDPPYGNLVVLPKELANEKGAYCLDGSPPGYYFRKGRNEGKNSWILFLAGGGWCYNISDCHDRSFSALGSSKFFPTQVLFDGFLANDEKTNADFYDWNVAYLAYCDGASFSGNADMPVKYKDRNIYFRGKRVLDLLLDYLLQHGLSEADRVIIGGVSAGGIAVYIHADYIKSKLPVSTTVQAFSDAGYIPDIRNITNFQNIRIVFQRIYNFQQVKGSLNKACLDANDRSSQWKCFFPQYSFQYIKTPMFVLNSAYDYWTLWYALDLRCYHSECDTKGKYYYTYYQKEFMALMQQVFSSTKDGVYISSCYAHSQASNGEWTNYIVNGTTPQEAFSDWYFSRKSVGESKYLDCMTPGCNPTCDWSLEFYNTTKAKLSTTDFFI